jgi:hypothetical protein
MRARSRGGTNLINQPPCDAVLGLTRRSKEQVFRSDDDVASRRSKFVGFTQQFFDVSREFSHGSDHDRPLRGHSRTLAHTTSGSRRHHIAFPFEGE